MDNFFQHRQGCVFGDDRERVHRVPIDCVTVPDLWKRIDQLEAELEGKRAKERHLMRKKMLSLKANLLCPCGYVVQTRESLDGHLDHLIEAEADASTVENIPMVGFVR